MKKILFIAFQKILPQKILSKLLGKLAHSRCSLFKNFAIRIFIRYFKVNMAEALITDINLFPSFNDFFIRQLNPQMRPIHNSADTLISPVDGTISALGVIHDQQLMQAKGAYFSLVDLLG